MSPNLLQTFVQNRVAEIHELTGELPWRHVSGKHNPADLVSRGMALEELVNSNLWWTGPEFLHDVNIDTTNIYQPLPLTADDLPETKGCPQALLYNIREEWWPIGGRNLARKPDEIFSDNGRNFVGLMNDFARFLSKCSSDIINYASKEQIKFRFIVPYAAHFGGLWEAGVRSCKHHLRRVVGNANLTYEELSTVLAQIEAILNSRPLSPMSSDPTDYLPLSPAHFLVGRTLTSPACEDFTYANTLRLTRYQRVEQMRQHYT
ncbi:uncharacterized protein LOC123667774 [Melitaea cinxia]|uniref:uncharacterized protein LOC123667774 n=1 Tax=Melitaea cinxia TaxID=113334 RepID=UPI001E273243|nr:uncharacterized protein LOC123667774 [Melitaea cinxia]